MMEIPKEKDPLCLLLSTWNQGSLSGKTGMSLDSLIRISNAVKNWESRDSQTLNEPSLEYGNFELSLGSLIKKHLKQHGMAQKTLAARVGTSAFADDYPTQKLIHKWIDGEKDHMEWEAQYLNYIDKLGYENFLIAMM